MTPSVRRTIRRLFPDHPESEILTCLTRYGRGIEHARSAIMYDLMLRCADGDLNQLNRLVEWALRSQEQFEKYMARFAKWIHEADRFAFGSPGYLQFFAPILRRFARPISEYQCTCICSMNTLCQSGSLGEEPFPADLYLVPVIKYGVYISTDDRAREGSKTKEIADWCPGELAAADVAPERIMYHVSQTFEHDCYPELADD